ncbi:hypothetical protein ABFX02_14G210900 [Erythranthe guttata]
MANQYADQVTASQVGSYFVQQYYFEIFQQSPDYMHKFYNDSSSMIRVDGETSHSATDIVKIHQLLMSQNFTMIEIKTINSLDSWSGGVLVVVSGLVKSRDFDSWRKFVQTFFLAPQDKGYFVLNDVFHFADDEVAAPLAAKEQNVDYQPTISTHLPNPTVSDYALEEEEGEYLNSVHTEGDERVQEYSYQEHLQQDLEPEPEFEPEAEVEKTEDGTPFEESRHLLQSTVTTSHEPERSVDEPVGEPEKFTYASILRAKGKTPPSISSQPALAQRQPAAGNYVPVSQPSVNQSIPNLPNSGVDSGEEAFSLQEGESKSVYVRNLPSTVTSFDIQQEFENFGRIKYDGVFLRNRMDTGVCYAFVEFEDVQGVRNAIKASPIQLAGKKVYIEERRPNSSASRGGRTGGRGRGGRGGRTSFGR